MIAVYASENCLEAVAFRDGLLAKGYKALMLSIGDHGRGQTIGCKAALVSGTRYPGDLVVEDYAARGIPTIVIDYGYLNRVHGRDTWETGHWQIGIGGLNRPPRFPCPDDRIERLGIAPKRARTGPNVLVLGQHSGDPSHGLTDEGMSAWAQRVCDETGGYWRPHPSSPHIEVDAPRADGPLGDWLGRVGMVRTLCSTGGLEALIAGVAAVADMPERASWGELSGPVHPGQGAVAELCSRLAYGQWTIEEMRSGEAAEFVLNNVERWNEKCSL